MEKLKKERQKDRDRQSGREIEQKKDRLTERQKDSK